jgi:hypothetical protein
MSVAVFVRTCRIRPINLGDGDPRLDRWDRLELDGWIDQLRGGAAPFSGDHWLAKAGDDGGAD